MIQSAKQVLTSTVLFVNSQKKNLTITTRDWLKLGVWL